MVKINELRQLEYAIKKLKLRNDWKYCLENSKKLYNYFKAGKVSTGAFYNTQGLSFMGHWFYISPSGKYVVDKVIHNHPSYNIIKKYEVGNGIFNSKDYLNSLGV